MSAPPLAAEVRTRGSRALLCTDEVSDARARLPASIFPTPLTSHPLLDARLGCQLLVKLENSLPMGAFKLRGALNLVASLGARDRAAGVVAPTRGNHGQALAMACRDEGIQCVLFVPEGNNPEKNRAMRAYGAEVVVVGEDFDAATRAAELHARTSGAHYVHPGREPALITGVATLTSEILDQSGGRLDYLFVPVGVGSCIAGAALALADHPEVTLVGVQAAAAPAMYHAFTGDGARVYPVDPTIADGLAVGTPEPLTMSLIRRRVDEMVLVDEDDLLAAVRLYAESLHQMAEGAGAAALAGALRLGDRLKGKRVAVVLTGGNVDLRLLSGVLASAGTPRGPRDGE